MKDGDKRKQKILIYKQKINKIFTNPMKSQTREISLQQYSTYCNKSRYLCVKSLSEMTKYPGEVRDEDRSSLSK